MIVCPRFELPDNEMKCKDARKSSLDILPTPVIPKAYLLDKVSHSLSSSTPASL